MSKERIALGMALLSVGGLSVACAQERPTIGIHSAPSKEPTHLYGYPFEKIKGKKPAAGVDTGCYREDKPNEGIISFPCRKFDQMNGSQIKAAKHAGNTVLISICHIEGDGAILNKAPAKDVLSLHELSTYRETFYGTMVTDDHSVSSGSDSEQCVIKAAATDEYVGKHPRAPMKWPHDLGVSH